MTADKRTEAEDPADEGEELVLHVDSGLMDWLGALVAGPGIFGNLDETAVYLLRTALIEMMRDDEWFAATVPHLPSPTREANMKSPRYRTLVKE